MLTEGEGCSEELKELLKEASDHLSLKIGKLSLAQGAEGGKEEIKRGRLFFIC